MPPNTHAVAVQSLVPWPINVIRRNAPHLGDHRLSAAELSFIESHNSRQLAFQPATCTCFWQSVDLRRAYHPTCQLMREQPPRKSDPMQRMQRCSLRPRVNWLFAIWYAASVRVFCFGPSESFQSLGPNSPMLQYGRGDCCSGGVFVPPP